MNKSLVSIINKFCLENSMKRYIKTSTPSWKGCGLCQLIPRKMDTIEIKEGLI
jgi:hypothetical protein